MRRPSVFAILAVLVTAVVAWLLFLALAGRYGNRRQQTDAPLPTATGPSQPNAAKRITATLFYISEDGMRLVGVKREVPFGATPAEQARRIVEEVLKPAPAPHASAIPQGTKLRSLYVTARGEAYVDLSREISEAHTGGSLDELFTVYSIVNALTVNLPAIESVQILVDGKEVDSLAGHIDLREPINRANAWIRKGQ